MGALPLASVGNIFEKGVDKRDLPDIHRDRGEQQNSGRAAT